MIKISVNLDDQDARTLEKVKAGRGMSKSDVIRTAIHEYCVKQETEQNCVNEAIDAAYGVCKNNPIDADAIRKDSNESGRI
jgi:metal-responsive CopG/Arc/MetJ family transcriptional regulator